MNPKANGQVQREWGWLIAAYLFLGGVGSGAYTIAAINGFMGKEMEAATQVGLWIGFPALAVGSLCLLADLGSPVRAVRAGMKVGTSWIARGFWIILAFMGLSLLHLVLFLEGCFRLTPAGAALVGVVSALGMLCAVGTMAYTGLLLGAAKGIPFWRSGVVPVLFAASALATGHFTMLLGTLAFAGSPATALALPVLGIEAAVLVVLEVLAIVLYLQSAYRLPDARESAERVLEGRAFVLGYFVLGLGVPLVIALWLGFGAAGAEPEPLFTWATVGGLLGLMGGLVLRLAVLQAGALPTWHLAGFEFRRCARVREPKPEIGLLPPAEAPPNR
ncbi:MAG: polysulfide reductase NrfD [Deltaproteobacteria bacterium]|nr:polysulfide reductase NrfD [Deltaproteobacteria bacterium]